MESTILLTSFGYSDSLMDFKLASRDPKLKMASKLSFFVSSRLRLISKMSSVNALMVKVPLTPASVFLKVIRTLNMSK